MLLEVKDSGQSIEIPANYFSWESRNASPQKPIYSTHSTMAFLELIQSLKSENTNLLITGPAMSGKSSALKMLLASSRLKDNVRAVYLNLEKLTQDYSHVTTALIYAFSKYEGDAVSFYSRTYRRSHCIDICPYNSGNDIDALQMIFRCSQQSYSGSLDSFTGLLKDLKVHCARNNQELHLLVDAGDVAKYDSLPNYASVMNYVFQVLPSHFSFSVAVSEEAPKDTKFKIIADASIWMLDKSDIQRLLPGCLSTQPCEDVVDRIMDTTGTSLKTIVSVFKTNGGLEANIRNLRQKIDEYFIHRFPEFFMESSDQKDVSRNREDLQGLMENDHNSPKYLKSIIRSLEASSGIANNPLALYTQYSRHVYESEDGQDDSLRQLLYSCFALNPGVDSTWALKLSEDKVLNVWTKIQMVDAESFSRKAVHSLRYVNDSDAYCPLIPLFEPVWGAHVILFNPWREDLILLSISDVCTLEESHQQKKIMAPENKKQDKVQRINIVSANVGGGELPVGSIDCATFLHNIYNGKQEAIHEIEKATARVRQLSRILPVIDQLIKEATACTLMSSADTKSESFEQLSVE